MAERQVLQMSDKRFRRPCLMCGEIFEYTYETKRRVYCDKCRGISDQIRDKEHREREKEKQIIARRAEAIAHQQDRSIWTPDYAQRQMQKTLSMLGRIEI